MIMYFTAEPLSPGGTHLVPSPWTPEPGPVIGHLFPVSPPTVSWILGFGQRDVMQHRLDDITFKRII